MSKHDEGRRAFLVALGAGAAATTALVPERSPKAITSTTPPQRMRRRRITWLSICPITAWPGWAAVTAPSSTTTMPRTIAAFAERLMPGAPGKPGATDADVLNYIDLALAGAYADLQDFYRRGARAARCLLHANLRQAVPHYRRRRSRTTPSPRCSRARRPASPGRRRKPSSTPCARTPWKACSPTRSTAATRTSPAGGWSAFPARSRYSRPRTCRAGKRSRARPSSACKRRPRAREG